MLAGTLAVVEIGGAHVAGLVVAWAIMQAISLLITTRIIQAGLEKQTAGLAATVDRMAETVRLHEEAINQGRLDQAKCQLGAAQAYATRTELVGVLAGQTRAWAGFAAVARDDRRAFAAKLDSVHGRITELAEDVAAMRGAGEASKT